MTATPGGGARLGRTVCLVLGVLSLAGSMEAMFHDVRAPAGGVSDLCGGATSPDEEIGPECSVAVLAHVQSALLRAVAGAGWMLGAVAFGLTERRPTAAAGHPPMTTAPAPAPAPYRPPAPTAPGPAHGFPWPHPRSG